MRARTKLADRVAQLDQRPGEPVCPGLCADLAHFIEVLQEVVPPGQLSEPIWAGAFTATEADRVQRQSRLLTRVAASVPHLTDGPIDLTAQYWIASGNPPWLPPAESEPRESSFIPVAATSVPPSGAKPFGVGLYTSTGTAGTYGMWQCYLREYENSATLHPMPWYTWLLKPRHGVRVYELRDAAAWVGLISAYPRVEGRFVQPDWAAVAAVYDAIHITLRAITAAEGFSFRTAHGPTAAPYWGVESTFWLNWCFDTVELAEVTRQRPGEESTSANSGPGTATESLVPPLSNSLPSPAIDGTDPGLASS